MPSGYPLGMNEQETLLKRFPELDNPDSRNYLNSGVDISEAREVFANTWIEDQASKGRLDSEAMAPLKDAYLNAVNNNQSGYQVLNDFLYSATGTKKGSVIEQERNRLNPLSMSDAWVMAEERASSLQAQTPEAMEESSLSRGATSAAYGYVADIASAVGAVADEIGLDSIESIAQDWVVKGKKGRARNQSFVSSSEDIKDFGSAMSWLGFTASSGAVDMGSALIPATGATTFLKAIKYGGDITKVAQRANAIAMATRMSGGTYQQIKDETGEKALALSALTGVVSGYLERIVPESFLNGLSPKTKSALAGAMVTDWVKEGLTEVSQDGLNLLAVKAIDNNKDLFTEENYKKLKESFLAGVVSSVVPSSASRGMSYLQGQRGQEAGIPIEVTESEEAKAQREGQSQSAEVGKPINYEVPRKPLDGQFFKQFLDNATTEQLQEALNGRYGQPDGQQMAFIRKAIQEKPIRVDAEVIQEPQQGERRRKITPKLGQGQGQLEAGQDYPVGLPSPKRESTTTEIPSSRVILQGQGVKSLPEKTNAPNKEVIASVRNWDAKTQSNLKNVAQESTQVEIDRFVTMAEKEVTTAEDPISALNKIAEKMPFPTTAKQAKQIRDVGMMAYQTAKARTMKGGAVLAPSQGEKTSKATQQNLLPSSGETIVLGDEQSSAPVKESLITPSESTTSGSRNEAAPEKGATSATQEPQADWREDYENGGLNSYKKAKVLMRVAESEDSSKEDLDDALKMSSSYDEQDRILKLIVNNRNSSSMTKRIAQGRLDAMTPSDMDDEAIANEDAIKEGGDALKERIDVYKETITANEKIIASHRVRLENKLSPQKSAESREYIAEAQAEIDDAKKKLEMLESRPESATKPLSREESLEFVNRRRDRKIQLEVDKFREVANLSPSRISQLDETEKYESDDEKAQHIAHALFFGEYEYNVRNGQDGSSILSEAKKERDRILSDLAKNRKSKEKVATTETQAQVESKLKQNGKQQASLYDKRDELVKQDRELSAKIQSATRERDNMPRSTPVQLMAEKDRAINALKNDQSDLYKKQATITSKLDTLQGKAKELNAQIKKASEPKADLVEAKDPNRRKTPVTTWFIKHDPVDKETGHRFTEGPFQTMKEAVDVIENATGDNWRHWTLEKHDDFDKSGFSTNKDYFEKKVHSKGEKAVDQPENIGRSISKKDVDEAIKEKGYSRVKRFSNLMAWAKMYFRDSANNDKSSAVAKEIVESKLKKYKDREIGDSLLSIEIDLMANSEPQSGPPASGYGSKGNLSKMHSNADVVTHLIDLGRILLRKEAEFLGFGPKQVLVVQNIETIGREKAADPKTDEPELTKPQEKMVEATGATVTDTNDGETKKQEERRLSSLFDRTVGVIDSKGFILDADDGLGYKASATQSDLTDFAARMLYFADVTREFSDYPVIQMIRDGKKAIARFHDNYQFDIPIPDSMKIDFKLQDGAYYAIDLNDFYNNFTYRVKTVYSKDQYGVPSQTVVGRRLASPPKKKSKHTDIWDKVDIEKPEAKAQEPKEAKPESDPQRKAKGAPVIESITLAEIDDLRKKLMSGDLKAEEVKASIMAIMNNEESLKAELSKKTVAQLSRLVNYPQGMKKAELVKDVYGRMILTLYPKSMYSHSGDIKKSMMKDVENITDEKIEAYIAESKKWSDDMAAEIKEIKNPTTLKGFRDRARYMGSAGLSVEQKRLYDSLIADEAMIARREESTKKATLRGDTEGILWVEKGTGLSRTGEEMTILNTDERLGKDQFKEMATRARQLGGFYARGKGFHLPKEKIKEFTGEVEDTKADERAEERIQSLQEKSIERLEAMVAKINNDADESLGADRKTNTAKRAREAASAEKSALQDKQTAKTLQNIIDGIKSGDVKYLNELSALTQLAELERLTQRAMWKANRELKRERASAQISGDEKQDPILEDIDFAEMPARKARYHVLEEVSTFFQNKPGLKLISNKIKKWLKDETPNTMISLSESQYATVAELVKKVKKSDRDNWSLKELIEDVQESNRVGRMGITKPPILRAALREYLSFRDGGTKADPIKEKERALIGRKIDGYFPTPKLNVSEMIEIADIQPGDKILEPSAGKGNIADQIREAAPDNKLEVIEINHSLRSILEDKGHYVADHDFMDFDPSKGGYDKIIMNPPFEKGQDIEHVMRAFDMLAPGGRLVAITSEGPFFRQDKKSEAFRKFVDENGSSERMEDGSFLASERSTGVRTRMVVLNKAKDETTEKGARMYSKVLDQATKPKSYSNNLQQEVANAKAQLNQEGMDVKFVNEGKNGVEAYADRRTNTVYINVDESGSKDIKALLVHEDFVHLALHGILGQREYTRVLNMVYKEVQEKGSGFEQLANRIKRAYEEDGSEMNDLALVDEVLAHWYEKQYKIAQPSSLFRDTIKKVVRFMRRVFKRERSDMKELTDVMHTAFNQYLKGNRGGPDGGGKRSMSKVLGDTFKAFDTKSKEFKAWFGDSKVVDENGDPLVVYHGTTNRFNEFDKTKTMDIGIHFGTKEQANDFATKKGGHVFPVYLSVKNMLELDFDPTVVDGDQFMYRGFRYYEDTLNRIIEEMGMGGSGNMNVDKALVLAEEADTFTEEASASEDDRLDGLDELTIPFWRALQDVMEEAGYDGYQYENQLEGDGGVSYSVFSPTQIKSAISNTGDFDPSNPDIRYSRKLDQEELAPPKDGHIRLYHNTSDSSMIFEKKHPIFGDTIFLSENGYGGLGGGESNNFYIDIDEDNIISARSLWYRDEWIDDKVLKLRNDFAKRYDIELDVVDELATEREEYYNIDSDPEFGWDVQVLTSKIGNAMGYDAVQGEDENGSVWMIEGDKEKNKLFNKFDEENDIRYSKKLDQDYRKGVDTKSKEFKAWFGDSKAVDEKGDPLVVYHGGDSDDLTNFSYGSMRGELGKAYFTEDKLVASKYAMFGGASKDEDIGRLDMDDSVELFEDMELDRDANITPV
jgi:phospholipid N-methyltransferase